MLIDVLSFVIKNRNIILTILTGVQLVDYINKKESKNEKRTE